MSSGFVLIVLAGVAVVLLTRRAGTSQRLLWWATTSGTVGSALLGAGLVLNIVVFDNRFRFMPAFVWPGLALVIAAVVLLASSARRAQVLPAPLVGVLIASALLLAASNEQTRLAWLSLPFGLSWKLVGRRLRQVRTGAGQDQRATPPLRA